MRANWIVMAATAVAANANPTVISSVTNYPAFSDAFGTSGSRMVEYEMDDGAGHFEIGYGVLNLATSSLSRDFPIATFDAAATPKYVATGAVVLTTFSAAVNVRCAPHATGAIAATPWSQGMSGNLVGLGNGYYTDNLTNVDQTLVTLQGWRAYYSYLWTGSRPITSCSIAVKSAGTVGFRVGIMERTGSGSFALLREFTASSPFDGTVTGVQTRVAPTDFAPLYLPPGPYLVQIVPSASGSNPTLRGCSANAFVCDGSILGRGTTFGPMVSFLDSAGASTLATTFSGNPGGGASGGGSAPQVIFGMG
jgi:hypothetical protein